MSLVDGVWLPQICARFPVLEGEQEVERTANRVIGLGLGGTIHDRHAEHFAEEVQSRLFSILLGGPFLGTLLREFEARHV